MSQMGHYFVLFSIRCSLSNVDVFFFQSPKVINWHDANTCKGKVPVDQLPIVTGEKSYWKSKCSNFQFLTTLRVFSQPLQRLRR